MILTIIKKELLENLKSQIFLTAFTFILLISAVCSFILVESFNEKLKENFDYNSQHERLLNTANPDGLGGIWMRPITPLPKLSMLFHGVSNVIGLPSLDRDTVPLLFPQTDFLMILGYFMSLMALLLSFSAVSGEKEEGMLRAVFSNTVRRSTLLIGKWIGGIISIMIPFSTCYLFAILVAFLKANVSWNATEWYSLLSIYVLGLIYISLFYLIGLYVSSKTDQSHISMLLSLLIWAFLVLILPTLPDYLGKEIFPAPSAAKFLYESELRNEMERKEIAQKIKEPYYKKGLSTIQIDSITHDEVQTAIKPLQEQRQKMFNGYQNKIVSQFVASTAITMLSPYASFTLAGNELSATGVFNQVYLLNQSGESYEAALLNYIEQRKKEERAKGNKVDGNTQLDLSGRPKFEYKEVPFILRIVAAGIPVLFLIIFNILFFVLAVRAFLRYDVR